MSHRSALTSAVQFIGSMGACASIGNSYAADNVFAAFLSASGALPFLRAAETSSLPSAESPGRSLVDHRPDLRVVEPYVRPLIPVDPQGIARLAGLPEVVRDDNDSTGSRQHAAHARHTLRGGRLDRYNLPSQRGTQSDDRIQHAGKLHIQTKLGTTVDLARGIE